LLQQPDVFLDEPTNHLDAESVLWLEQHLAQYAGTDDRRVGFELDRGEGIP
jgi:ATPase subunit of ABC transporter with duplicated ATPase domains